MILPICMICEPSIDSTNAQAKRCADSWDPNSLTLLRAERQSAGYGRFGRIWSSPPGNLYCSYIYVLSPPLPPFHNSAQIAALALAQTIEELSPLRPQLKWPNDLLLEGKKVAGILVESTMRSDGKLCLIIGIGLNIATPLETLEKLGQPAISLNLATQSDWEIERVVLKLNTNLPARMEELFSEGFQKLRPHYLSRLLHRKGDPMPLSTTGTFFDIDSTGRLLLIDSTGALITLAHS